MMSAVTATGVTISHMKDVGEIFHVENVGSKLLLNQTIISDNNQESSWTAVFVGHEATATIYRSQFLSNTNVQVC